MKVTISYEDLTRILVHVGNRLSQVARPRQRDDDLTTELSIALRYARQRNEPLTIEVTP